MIEQEGCCFDVWLGWGDSVLTRHEASASTDLEPKNSLGQLPCQYASSKTGADRAHQEPGPETLSVCGGSISCHLGDLSCHRLSLTAMIKIKA